MRSGFSRNLCPTVQDWGQVCRFQGKNCGGFGVFTDDYTVGRVIQVFTTQQNDLWLFDEQLRRWEKGPLTNAQRREVERLAS